MKIKILLIFIIGFFLIINCKKEKVVPSPYYGPFVITPYHIKAFADGILVDASYSYQDPDTLNSVYLNSKKYFSLKRSTSDNSSNESWLIYGHIDLDQTIYPKTFWPSIPFNDSTLNLAYEVTGGAGLSTNKYDSTLFSITLEGFDHDTLWGSFHGDLFQLENHHNPDSAVTVTNGVFKILLVRKP